MYKSCDKLSKGKKPYYIGIMKCKNVLKKVEFQQNLNEFAIKLNYKFNIN